MSWREAYGVPPRKMLAPAFCLSSEVRWSKYPGQKFKVRSSTHTHTQLEGIRYAVPNWELKTVRRRKKIKK